MYFLEYELKSDLLCIGERTKGGLIRPCSKTIRYSLITGVLKETFGLKEVHAVGHLIKTNDKYNREECITYSPKNNALGCSKIPLKIQVLTNVLGFIYILKNEEIVSSLKDEFELIMGAFRSKGFGRCKLTKKGEVNTSETLTNKYSIAIPGTLTTRIPILPSEDELVKLISTGQTSRFLNDIFGIQRVVKPKFGYLFQPDNERKGGKYIISLFEGSKVIGPKFLMEEAM